jgi:caspase domain-containing protein
MLAVVACLLAGSFAAAPVRAGSPEEPRKYEAITAAPSMEEPITPAAAEVRRFALLVGANDGGSDRVKLHYANSDADAVADVMRNIGGVLSGDLIQLRDPTPEELDIAFDAMATRLRAASASGVRTQLLFYYSGHSDEKGLLLAGERVGYGALRKQVQGVPADVKIAILDSCASGAFTRAKGGTKRPPFLAGSASAVEGHAFLTSSSANEAAQESDRVGGSFFTHFFTTGLRGAADIDGDRYVTLTEAYRFAFDETLERTESTRGGAQHAAYDIQLAGSGDLVMTDLRKPSATLVLADDVTGRVSVRGTSGRLAAELFKPAEAGALSLAVEPGKYQVLVDDGKARRRADVEIGRRGRVGVSAKDFRVVPMEYASLRGGDTARYEEVPFDIGLIPPASINGSVQRKHKDPELRIRNRASFSFGWNRATRVDGISLGLAASIIDEELHGVQGAMGAAITRGTVEGWQFGQFFNHAGTLVGAQTGIVNHVTTIEKGVQLGLVNTGGNVKGVQIGLVNWAKEANASVGLITLTKKGSVHPEVWTSNVAAFNLGLRFPAKYTYSMFTMGMHPFGPVGRGQSWQFGLGWGGHAELGKTKAFMDVDLSGFAILQGFSHVKNQRPGGLAMLRLTFGYQFLDRVAIFGGPTLSVFTRRRARHCDEVMIDVCSSGPVTEQPRPGYGWSVAERHIANTQISITPGFAAGLRF